MPEPVRVRDNKTGAEYSTYAVTEDGRVDQGLTVLNEPATDVRGDLLPPTYPAQASAPATRTPAATTGRAATTEES
jgi:hypothetical protein